MHHHRITGSEPVITLEYTPGKPITYERHASGTYYKALTPHGVREELESARCRGNRLRLFFGDTDGEHTGRDWLEEFECIGTVGRSQGPLRVPLLIRSKRHHSGGAIADDRILRIVDVATKCERYRDPAYRKPVLHVAPSSISADPRCAFAVYRSDDGQRSEEARFATRLKAENWAAFMRGERMAA